DVTGFGTQAPVTGIASNSIYMFFPDPKQLIAIDAKTSTRRWERLGLALDRNHPLIVRPTAKGEVFIGKTDRSIHAIRSTDGTDAWLFEPKTDTFSYLMTDRSVIVFEPDRGVTV